MSHLFNNEDQSNQYLSRPDYNDEVIQEIIRFWQQYNPDQDAESRLKIVGVGCGTGQLTMRLLPYAGELIGVDASEHQIANAKKLAKDIPTDTLRFELGNCDSLPVQNNYVDLITCSQAFHWFDVDAFYSEVNRCLKPRGVLAILTHGKGYFIDGGDQHMLQKMNKFVSYEFWFDARYFGPYITERPRWAWEFLPGLRFLYPDSGVRLENMSFDVTFSIQRYGEYLRSSSMYRAWKESNLENEDIIDFTINKILDYVGQPTQGMNTELTMRFPLCMIMCSKPQNNIVE